MLALALELVLKSIVTAIQPSPEKHCWEVVIK